MDATIFFVGLYDETSQMIQVVWQVERGLELPRGSFPLGSGFASQVILSGRAGIIRHWSREGPRVQVQYATGTPGLPESAIAAPIRVGEQVIGLLMVQSYSPNVYSDADARTLELLADEAGVFIASANESEEENSQLQRRASELEAILSNMADALVIVDATASLVRLNRAARELLCLDNASIVVGQPIDDSFWEAWPPSGRAVAEALRPVIEALQQTQRPNELEVDVGATGGRTLSFRASPLHDLDGSYAGGIIVFRDVTGRREMERLKDEMLSIASHDLKTPATVIKAQAQLLKRRVKAGGAQAQDVEEGLTMISDQADRLSKLLNLLLDLSRIESGRLKLEFVPTDARSILVSMARALESTSEQHHIEVDARDGIIGHWDSRRIEEVVQNLLNNAVKYTPGGGTIKVSLTAEDGYATILVRDPGIGLAQEELPRVFERFYRGAGIKRLEGTGLGLYICRAIVAAHGGRIWGESPGPGQGATFGFTLPLRPPEPRAQD